MKCDKCNGSLVLERGTVGQPDEMKCIGCGKRTPVDATPAAAKTAEDRSDKARLLATIRRLAPVNRRILIPQLRWNAEKINEVAAELIAEEKIAPWPTVRGGCIYTLHGAPDPRMSDPEHQERSGPKAMREARGKQFDARAEAPTGPEVTTEELAEALEGYVPPPAAAAPCKEPQANGGGRTSPTEERVMPREFADALEALQLRYKNLAAQMTAIDEAIRALKAVA